MILTRREILAAIGAASMATNLASCRGGASPVTIGYQKNGLLLLAKLRGTVDAALRDAGRPSAQWIEFPSGPPMLEAMAAGSVDLGAVGESPPIFAQAAGSPVVYVAAEPVSGRNEAILVHERSALRTIADLKGRKVAFTKASAAHLLLAKALHQAGLTFADVIPINLAPADAASAFATGAIDAWSIWDPFYALAVDKGDVRVIVSGDQLPASDAFFVATRHAVTDKRSDILLVLESLRMTAAWAQAHVAESVTLIAQQSGLPERIVKVALRRGDFRVDPIAPAVVQRQQANADLFAALGLLPVRVNIADAVWKP